MSEELFYTFRFSLIGDKGVGKTTLANKFCGIKEAVSSTISTQFLSKSLWLSGINNHVCVKYLLSDNPNFIDQRNNTAISIKDNAVFFFIFDLSKRASFDQMEDQLETIRTNNNNTSQIHILLANQTDPGRTEVSIDDAKEFANSQ